MSRSCAALFFLLAACGTTRSADTMRAPRRARPLNARLAALVDQASAPVRSAEALEARIATLLGPVELSPDASGAVVIEETYCPRPDGCWVFVKGRPFDLMIGIRRTAHGWRGVDSNLPGLVHADTF